MNKISLFLICFAITIQTQGSKYLSGISYSSENSSYYKFEKSTNRPPIANAGSEQFYLIENKLVTLDGTKSSDPDGDKLNYKWTAPEGIVLNSDTIPNPSFIAKRVVNFNWVVGLEFTLVVSDGIASSAPSKVKIHFYLETDARYFNFDPSTGTIIKYNKVDFALNSQVVIPQYINGVLVKAIGNKAFYATNDCNSIDDFISVPEGVVSIGDDCFEGCYWVDSIILPSTLQTIGKQAFLGCGNLSSLKILENVSFIGERCFPATSARYHKVFNSIFVDDKNIFFSDIDGVLFNKSKTELVCYPAFKLGASYVVPDNVKKIQPHAFDANYYLASIVLPDGLTYIGDFAFNLCFALSSINIPNTVKKIERVAFGSNSGLTSVTIPQSVDTIGSGAFSNCINLNAALFEGDAPLISTSSYDKSDTTIFNYVNSNFRVTYKKCKTGFSTPIWKGNPCFPESNCQPVANAGSDLSVFEGDTVILDGAKSTDTDKNALTYNWISSENIALDSSSNIRSSFIAPQVDGDSAFTFKLVVNDGEINSDTDVVVVFIKNGVNVGIESFSNLNFNVFPNPTSGVIEVKILNNNCSVVEISILNYLGQSIINKQFDAESKILFDLSEFSKGIYFISVKANEKQYYRKFLIEK